MGVKKNIKRWIRRGQLEVEKKTNQIILSRSRQYWVDSGPLRLYQFFAHWFFFTFGNNAELTVTHTHTYTRLKITLWVTVTIFSLHCCLQYCRINCMSFVVICSISHSFSTNYCKNIELIGLNDKTSKAKYFYFICMGGLGVWVCMQVFFFFLNIIAVLLLLAQKSFFYFSVYASLQQTGGRYACRLT